MATYITQEGDTLWAIAQRLYGDGAQWQRIYNANVGTIGANPNYMRAGWRLTIPDLSGPVPPAPGHTYVTTESDTLWAIAQRFYEDGAQWPKIYEANKNVIGPDPDVLRPKLTLYIPV
jgi:nucleoid-associated protein YgaU